MPETLVSIIVPCYNVASCVADSLRSLDAQTYGGLQVICVDDGSTDATLQVLRDWQQITALESVVVHVANGGASMARNKGMELVKGQWIQFLDADDILYPEKIATQMTLVENAQLSELVVGDYVKIREGKQEKGIGEKPSWLGLMNSRLGITSANLWRAEAVRSAGGWNEQLDSSQEYDLMFRMLKNKAHVLYDHGCNTEIHVRPNQSISELNKGQNLIRFVELRRQILEYVKKEHVYEELDPFYQSFFDAIRMLYPYDSQAAQELHSSYIKGAFKPRESEVTTKSYLAVYNKLGFKAAEQLKRIAK